MQSYGGKKVLVTGGAGFIGSHLVEKLVNLGAKVTVLDNFTTGSLNNLQSVLTNINLLYTDVTTLYSVMRAIRGMDFVFHLAAFVSVPQSLLHPEICMDINVTGTKNILEACKEHKVKAMVYSSSSAIYGNKNESCNERDTPQPQSPYATSKLQAEKLCKKYAQLYDIPISCLRYFNVYGARQNPRGEYAAVVAKFKENLLQNKPLIIYGDGNQTRDFIHVSKIVEANLKIALIQENRGELYNIGSGKSMSLLELIAKLEKELNTPNKHVTFSAARHNDIQHSRADCKKINQTLSL